MIEKTFAIIKPDAVKRDISGFIIAIIELNGFKILNLLKKKLNKEEAEKFYAIHKDKPFFNDLINYITSDYSILLELEKEDAVNSWRELMGATDPQKAKVGTIRKMVGKSIDENSVHGSDSLENAKLEISMFF